MKRYWTVLDLSRSHIIDRGDYVIAELSEYEQENLPYQDNSVIEDVYSAINETDEDSFRIELANMGYPTNRMGTIYQEEINILFPPKK